MYLLAIDQGTTGTTTVLYDQNAQVVSRAYQEFTQIYPHPGWVEHDPEEIWETVKSTVASVLEGVEGKVISIGITNQRETTIVWNKNTHKPIHNAIVWQCRRTAKFCDSLADKADALQKKTGLPLDAYFSGTKINWLLTEYPDVDRSELAFGTIDSWLIWKLTNGKSHVTDYTNASRTLLFNIEQKEWDDQCCEWLGVPVAMLPKALPSKSEFGKVESIAALKGVPIQAVLGDQQAALYGQTCFNAGELKNTYGTGAFVVLNTGDKRVYSKHGLVTTIAASAEGEPVYALEGSIFIAGAAIQWLRDEMQIIKDAADSEKMSTTVSDNAGVYLVPAFVGLGAPHWQMDARATITGLTRGANRNHIVRAALESMAYQTADVLDAMRKDIDIPMEGLAVDGGATANNFLMQFQADILQLAVHRPKNIESTSLGVALLAGVAAGIWKNAAELKALKTIEKEFHPRMSSNDQAALMAGWNLAIKMTSIHE